MTPRATRRAGLFLAIAGVGGFIAGVVGIGDRLAHRNHEVYRFVGRIDGDAFAWRGAEGRVDRVPPLGPGVAPGDPASLRITWRGQTVEWPMGAVEQLGAPGLDRYENWFQVFLLADGAASDEDLREMWSGGAADGRIRLVAAARYTADGFDPESWGAVRRREWVYRLAELDPDGPAETSLRAHTKRYEELDNLLVPGKYSKKYRPETLPESDEARRRDLWMHYAMQQVTPAPQFRGKDKAIEEFVAWLGWPWPVAAASTLAMLAGVGLMASTGVSRRAQARRREAVAPPAPGPAAG